MEWSMENGRWATVKCFFNLNSDFRGKWREIGRQRWPSTKKNRFALGYFTKYEWTILTLMKRSQWKFCLNLENLQERERWDNNNGHLYVISSTSLIANQLTSIRYKTFDKYDGKFYFIGQKQDNGSDWIDLAKLLELSVFFQKRQKSTVSTQLQKMEK
jgi:hypothetical protein